MHKLKLIVGCILAFLTNIVYAVPPTLGEVSNELTSGAGVLAKVMWAACIIVGIALIAAGFTQFQIHRRNPKLVPLTTPVMYLILGVLAIGLPFVNRIMSFLGNGPGAAHGVEAGARDTSVRPMNPNHPAASNPNDIDAPL